MPLAIEFVQAGFNVIGIDIDENKIDSINQGINYIQDADDDQLKKAVKEDKLKATNDYSIVKDLDSISICVPTPLNKQKDPDISYSNFKNSIEENNENEETPQENIQQCAQQ